MDDTISASDFSSAEASLSSTPAETTPTSVEPPAPVDQTAQPGEATTQPAVEPTAETPSTEPVKTGPIPFDVHKTALDNARTKAAAEALQKYAGLERVTPEQWQSFAPWVERYAQDPAGFLVGELTDHPDPIGVLQQALARLGTNPAHAQTLKSLAARALAQRQQQAEPQEPQPDLVYQTDNGPVHLYSAEQQAKREAFLQQRWEARMDQKIQPLQQTHAQMQAAREAQQAAIEDDRFASAVSADVKSWPGVTDDAMKQMADLVARDPRLPAKPTYEQLELAVNRAYRQVVPPGMQTTSRQAVLDDINRQANASTVNPARQGTRTPKSMDDMSIAEALRHVAAQSA